MLWGDEWKLCPIHTIPFPWRSECPACVGKYEQFKPWIEGLEQIRMNVPNEKEKEAVDTLAKKCYSNSYEHGFWDVTPRNKAEMICLIHSELSECLEGVRDHSEDKHCPEFTSEEVELADAMIRILDYAFGHNLRLSDAMTAKMKFNINRPPKHGKNF